MIAPIMGAVRGASGSDPGTAEQRRTNREETLRAIGVLAEILADRGALASGLTVADATDVIFALNSIEVFLLLTVTRGWSVQRWEQWLVPHDGGEPPRARRLTRPSHDPVPTG